MLSWRWGSSKAHNGISLRYCWYAPCNINHSAQYCTLLQYTRLCLSDLACQAQGPSPRMRIFGQIRDRHIRITLARVIARSTVLNWMLNQGPTKRTVRVNTLRRHWHRARKHAGMSNSWRLNRRCGPDVTVNGTVRYSTARCCPMHQNRDDGDSCSNWSGDIMLHLSRRQLIAIEATPVCVDMMDVDKQLFEMTRCSFVRF